MSRESVWELEDREIRTARIEGHARILLAAMVARGEHLEKKPVELACAAFALAEAMVNKLDGIAERMPDPERCKTCRGPLRRMGDGQMHCTNHSCKSCHPTHQRRPNVGRQK